MAADQEKDKTDLSQKEDKKDLSPKEDNNSLKDTKNDHFDNSIFDPYLKDEQPQQENTSETPKSISENFQDIPANVAGYDNSVFDPYLKEEIQQAKYGTPGQQLKAGLEGAAQGVVGPLAPLAETQLLGVKPEDILAREEANPGTHMAGEATGLVAPTLLTGGAAAPLAKMTQVGLAEAAAKKIADKLGLVAGETLASKIGTTSAKMAIENALIAGSDETSRMILNDPEQSVETAAATIGMAGLLGAGVGASLGSVSHLWRAKAGHDAKKLIEDFRERVDQHIQNPDPVATMTEELSQHYKNINDVADEVFGPTGLKAQDIRKAVPEMSDKILSQTNEIKEKLGDAIAEMRKKPSIYPRRLTQKLANDFENLSTTLAEAEDDPAKIFEAIQGAKQQLQVYAKYDKAVKSIDPEYDFVQKARNLATNIRESLEDAKVWGKAAERQREINKAFTSFLPSLKDFNAKFTTAIGGEKVIDPGKINTYLNQVGKPNAEIKQEMLKNFLDASDKYAKVLDATHANLGLESPFVASPLNVTRASLGEKTLGSRLADTFIKQGLGDAGGKGLGAIIGGGVGHMLGHGELGAIIGAYALNPFLKTTLSAIAKNILKNPASADGLKAAVDYATAIVKGETLLAKGARNLFKKGEAPLAEALRPKDKDREQLDELLKSLQQNPMILHKKDNKIDHYLPDHNVAMSQKAAQGLEYLTDMRAPMDKQAPLDSVPVPSRVQLAAYRNALDIAQQPLVVLNRIKSGTLTLDDIHNLGRMYPRLYQRMQQKIMDEIVNTQADGHKIPYKMRASLSMFMGQPLDSTFSPMAIQSSQLSQKGGTPPQPAPAKQSHKGRASAPGLQKMPGLFQTSGQHRMERMQKV